jgi:hypothetical protein
MRKLMLSWLVVLLAAVVVGCQGATTTAPSITAIPPTDTPAAVPTAASKPSPTVAESSVPVPQDITFQASDGQELKGRFYPATVQPAPVVVLMHWVNGDMTDWFEIAPWLQNRGLKNPYPDCTGAQMPSKDAWWDPTWFPQVPPEESYAVFIFTFRDHKPCEGANSFNEAAWLLDAQAAISKAAELDGVDPTKIVTIGSSIGADGAADACYWLNEKKPDSCLGALSLSPGGFLGIPYVQAVTKLGKEQHPKAAWCLADAREIGVCKSAESAKNPGFRAIEIANGHHGNFLLVKEAEPSAMQTILDFLHELTK